MGKITKTFFLLLVLIFSSCQFPGFKTEATGCGPSTLKIGDRSYQIKTIKAKKDDTLKIPANESETAFWVDGTNINQVFALSPTENNLVLPSSLKNGETISVTWENCNSTKYTISGLQTSVPEDSALLNQSVSQVTVFVRGNSNGFAVKGDLAEESINTFNTTDASEKQAEISLLETSAVQDGKSIKLSISINNYGNSTFTLSPDDVSLTAQDGTGLALNNSEPALPKEIATGATETISFTFPRPSTPTAILKILTVEYDIEGY